jgi:hypothetical protein
MMQSGEILEEFEVIDYKVPLIDKDKTQNDVTVTSEEIAKMPNRSAKSTANSVGGVYSQPVNNGSVRGARAMRVINDDIEIDPHFTGQITATEINDFSKWELWQNLKTSEFAPYYEYWNIYLNERYVVEIINEDYSPAIGLKVALKNKLGDIVWESRTDNTGKAELWSANTSEDKKLWLDIEKTDGTIETIKPKPFSKAINRIRLNGHCETPEVIDIAFMVDATGSMDDEINFLKSDLVDIIEYTANTFPEKQINSGSVFYRCKSNEYETRLFDLTSDIEESVDFINEQDANEGGDELVEVALEKAVNDLSWSENNMSIKILFIILDQQPSPTSSTFASLNSSIRKASSIGIRIVPIVASAETMVTATTLEYLMRTLSLATNGTNLFLTNHSKIGNKHATPKTDEYDVEYLNEAVKRIIYQYSFTTECGVSYDMVKVDTTYIYPKKIIAHEVVDSTIKVAEKDPNIKFVDLTHGEGFQSTQDTISSESFNNMEIFPIGLKFFPNPTNGPLNIEIRGDVKELFVFDINGKLLQRFDIRGRSNFNIDMIDWTRGIYFLKYQINDEWFSGKIILYY